MTQELSRLTLVESTKNLKGVHQIMENVLSMKNKRWNKFIEEITPIKFHNLNAIQKSAVLVFWYHTLMCNGGHSAYFDSDYFNEDLDADFKNLYDALIEVGMPDIAENYKMAHRYRGLGKDRHYVKSDEKFFDLEEVFFKTNRLC